MRKIISTLFAICLLYMSSSAQYCGTSDSSLCQPDTLLTQPGFSPVTDSLIPFVNGINYSTVISFKNYDSVPGEGQAPLDSLKIDSIGNLPSGLCWATNKKNNTFYQNENACLVLSGTVCSAPGQYLITILAHVNGFGPLNLGQLATPVKYWIRVKNASDNTTAVDTNQSTPFVSYNQETVIGCTSGISGPGAPVNSLSIIPNPINTTAVATFNSIKSGVMTERITNIIGAELHEASKEVKVGSNQFTIERSNLPPGVYFYSLSDGQTLITKRMVISE